MKQKMTPEEKAIHDAEMIAKRQAEIQENIVWWRKISDQRVNGFDIKETDPMFAEINERYRKNNV